MIDAVIRRAERLLDAMPEVDTDNAWNEQMRQALYGYRDTMLSNVSDGDAHMNDLILREAYNVLARVALVASDHPTGDMLNAEIRSANETCEWTITALSQILSGLTVTR